MDELKELIQTVERLPGMVLWILGGYLVYKLVIVGSWVALFRLVVNKVHDFFTKPRTITREVCLSNRFITMDGTYTKFLDIIALTHGRRSKPNPAHKGDYLHRDDVEWMRQAIVEKMTREEFESSQEKAK
jgi:hypothetical protein